MATLFDLAQAYLNRGMPSISPIFSNTTPTPTPQPTPPTQDPVQGLTPEQLLLLSSQRGGGNDPRGGGLFGNLDLSSSKTFTKNVYDEELGDFIPTELTGYKNLNSGLYQTFEGKNVNPMFSNTGLPSFGLGSLAAKMFGFEPQTVGGYVPGSIQGFYNTPMDFFKRNKNEQRATVQQLADQRKKDLARINALKAMTTNAASGGNNQPDGSGGYTGGFDSSTGNYDDPYSDDTE